MATNPIQQPISISCRVFLEKTGRLLFAFLGTRRTQPVSKAQVIDAVWGTRTPPSADRTINALVSKLRSALRTVGVPPPHGVATEVGTYQFLIPAAWIDIEHARAEVLAALEAVDLVVVFKEDTPLELIRRVRPTVLIKGADYRREDVVGRELVEADGGEIVLVELLPGHSSSGLVERSRTPTKS